ncbi:hypothetical protein B484DRAFT_407515, partial [Ochromonadaceae sp. CCMP2298]
DAQAQRLVVDELEADVVDVFTTLVHVFTQCQVRLKGAGTGAGGGVGNTGSMGVVGGMVSIGSMGSLGSMGSTGSAGGGSVGVQEDASLNLLNDVMSKALSAAEMLCQTKGSKSSLRDRIEAGSFNTGLGTGTNTGVGAGKGVGTPNTGTSTASVGTGIGTSTGAGAGAAIGTGIGAGTGSSTSTSITGNISSSANRSTGSGNPGTVVEALEQAESLQYQLALVRILKAVIFAEAHLLEMIRVDGFRKLSAVTHASDQPALTSQVAHLLRAYLEFTQAAKLALLQQHAERSLQRRAAGDLGIGNLHLQNLTLGHLGNLGNLGSVRSRAHSNSSTGSMGNVGNMNLGNMGMGGGGIPMRLSSGSRNSSSLTLQQMLAQTQAQSQTHAHHVGVGVGVGVGGGASLPQYGNSGYSGYAYGNVHGNGYGNGHGGGYGSNGYPGGLGPAFEEDGDREGGEGASMASVGLSFAYSFVSELLKFTPISAQWLQGPRREKAPLLEVLGQSDDQLMAAGMLLPLAVMEAEMERIRRVEGVGEEVVEGGEKTEVEAEGAGEVVESGE